MDDLSITIHVFRAVIFANIMTALFVYGAYRLVKRDLDPYGLFLLSVPIVAVLASHSGWLFPQ